MGWLQLQLQELAQHCSLNLRIVTRHGRGGKGAGCAGRATRRRSGFEAAAVRGDVGGRHDGLVGSVGSTNNFFLRYQKCLKIVAVVSAAVQ